MSISSVSTLQYAPINYGPRDDLLGPSITSLFTDSPILERPLVKPDTNSKEFLYAKIYSSDFEDLIVKKMISIKRDLLDWTIISKKPLTETFIDEFKDFIKFDILVKNPIIFQNDYSILSKFKEKFDFKVVCRDIYILESFMALFYDDIIWSSLVLNDSFTEKMILQYSKEIDWSLLVGRKNLSPDFVREHIDILNLSDEKIIEIFNKLPTNLNLTYYLEKVFDNEPLLSGDVRGNISNINTSSEYCGIADEHYPSNSQYLKSKVQSDPIVQIQEISKNLREVQAKHLEIIHNTESITESRIFYDISKEYQERQKQIFVLYLQ